MRDKSLKRYNRPLVSLNTKTNSKNQLRIVAPRIREVPRPPSGNLPVRLTPFIGRQNEVEVVSRLISNPTVHLLTLYGPAGTGKTRLSLAVGEYLKNEFKDGVFFVNLAPITKLESGLTAIALSLGIHDQNRLPILRKLQNYLQKRELLLILDNFEQVLDLGATITELLESSPRLKVLVTSRTILQLYGEHVYAVPTLQPPTQPQEAAFANLLENESVRLFVQHATMANSEFKLTEENIRLIAAICVHLEGLPLAIELAASRSNVLSPQLLLDRLVKAASNRFEILNSDFGNLPPRHQSLADALDWSYQLLCDEEKLLFRRLGIFAGSFSLEAAETLASDNQEVLENLTCLLNDSLLKQIEAAPGEDLRFTMLETIREYALEKLTEAGEVEMTRRVYNRYFTEMVETGVEKLKTPEQLNWLKRLAADYPNILRALENFVDSGNAEEAFRLGGNIWVVWWRWGYLNQGRQWLYRILELDYSKVDNIAMGKVLDGMAYLAMYQSDYRSAETYFEQSLEIWRKADAPKFLARAISGLAGTYRILGNYDQALQLNYESLETFRQTGDVVSEADGLINIGWQLMERGNYETVQEKLETALAIHTKNTYLSGIGRAKIYLGDYYWRKNDPVEAIRLLEEGVAVLRQVNHRIQIPSGLYRLGLVILCQGQLGPAQKLLEENIEIAEEMSKTLDLTYAYSSLGLLRLVQNNLDDAVILFRKAVDLRSEIGQLEGVLWGLEGLTVVALRQGRTSEAQDLMEDARNLRKAIDAPVLPHTIKFILPKLLSFQYGDKLAAPNVDRNNPRFQPVNRALSLTGDPAVRRKEREVELSAPYEPEGNSSLTGREIEVLRLLAEGHSNTQIARLLVISPGTVNNHLGSIYSKLGVNSRTAAVRYAHEYRLL